MLPRRRSHQHPFRQQRPRATSWLAITLRWVSLVPSPTIISQKIAIGPRTHFVLRLLAKGKPLRGTLFDPFGYTRMRRIERRLIAHYEATINRFCSSSPPRTTTRPAIARAPELIRGYEEVKMHNLERYFARLGELGIDTPALLP